MTQRTSQQVSAAVGLLVSYLYCEEMLLNVVRSGGIKLLDQVMKLFERVMERKVRNLISLDDMQFGFRPGRGTTDAIFIVRQIQEKFLAEKKISMLWTWRRRSTEFLEMWCGGP